MRATKINVPKGFFQFSTPQYHREDLYLWELWFIERGYNIKVGQDSRGYWVLFREGKDANDESTSSI